MARKFKEVGDYKGADRVLLHAIRAMWDAEKAAHEAVKKACVPGRRVLYRRGRDLIFATIVDVSDLRVKVRSEADPSREYWLGVTRLTGFSYSEVMRATSA
jgi:hypothetical protein